MSSQPASGRRAPDPPMSRDRRKLLLGLGLGVASLPIVRWGWPGSSSPLEAGVAGPSPFDGLSTQGAVTVGTRSGVDPASPAKGSTLDPAQSPAPGPAGREPATLDPDLDELPEDHLFDLTIVGGRVVDPESGFDGMANVGIDGDRILEISPRRIAGRRVIDATGLIVAPGFVDLLSYAPNRFGVWAKLADGVTTNLAMHGVSNYAEPFFANYEGSTPIHFGAAFHHHFLRGYHVGADIHQPVSHDGLVRLQDLARENLAQGFAGISFSPEYSPGTTTEEMEALARVAAEAGHVCFFHLRHSDPDPPGTSLEALDEALGIGGRVRCPVHIQHLTSTGGTFVMDEALARIEAARSRRIDATACVYPYDFWGTFLASPRFSAGWEERYRLTVNDLQIAGTDRVLADESWSQAVRENHLVAALGSIPEEEIQMALTRPFVMVASDAIPTRGLNNHPRGAGTFARTIGRYVRDLGVLDLRTGLAKITVLPALRVQSMIPAMAAKGRIQRGADADITIFDPVTISDRATVESPGEASVGIKWVVVAGEVALVEGVPQTEVRAGRALRSG